MVFPDHTHLEESILSELVKGYKNVSGTAVVLPRYQDYSQQPAIYNVEL